VETNAVMVNLGDEVQGKDDQLAGIETAPFICEVTITGVAPILFHRWDCAAVDAKSKAKKNSKEKKSDNLESYVYRCEDGNLSLPGVNLAAAFRYAGKSKQDPRSPRKSAYDLMKAILLVTPNLVSFGKKKWDFEDARRVVVQRSGITRVRPAMSEGWTLKFQVTVLDGSYVDEHFLYDLISSAGKFNGLGDFRPQFGRFNVTHFKRLQLR